MPAVLSASTLSPRCPPAGPPGHGGGLQFLLRTSGGAELRLECPAAEPAAQHAVAHALALAPALPLLEALETWLGTPFDAVAPQPAPAPWPGAARALTLPLPLATGIRLALPWPLLPLGRAAPPALAPALAALPVALQVEIDRIAVHRLPASELLAGALLLLPRSFAAGGAAAWPVRLVPAAAGLPALAGARWDAPAGWLQPQRPAPADAPGAGHAVVLDGLAVLPLGAWFGVPAPGMALAAGAAALQLGERPVNGRLVPCGAGFGLLLGPAPAR